MHLNRRKIGIGTVIVLLVLVGAVGITHWIWPGGGARRPALATVPPLAPTARSSAIIAPVAIALTAIGDAIERAAPADLAGKPELPAMPFVSNPEIEWSVSRGPLAVTARPEGLAISAALTGALRAGGQMTQPGGPPGPPGGFSGPPGGFPGPPGGFFGPPGGGFPGPLGGFSGPPGGPPGPPGGFSDSGGSPAQAEAQNQKEKAFERRAEIRGNVILIMRPTLLPGWRIEPNLTSQITIADASLSLFGLKLSVPDQVKPLLDRAVNQQVSALQAQLQNSPVLEQAARQEWAKMCRSLSLGAVAPGMPNLWLELRPTRAFAAQPGVDQTSVLLTIGVQAETRIVPNETKPDCPFPAQLEIVPQMEQGRINIAVPIDIPFTELNRLLEAQLKGKTFPEDKSGAFTATVRGVKVAASGDRLLMSVDMRANETKSWFGFGADATIHVWGRPMLDRGRQMLRLGDVAIDIESAAAFGMLGAAARAAVPYLEKALAENAVIDLAQVADNARKNIQAAVAEFRKRSDAVRVDAEAADLRLVGIEFDSKTLRVTAEADGTVRAVVTKLEER